MDDNNSPNTEIKEIHHPQPGIDMTYTDYGDQGREIKLIIQGDGKSDDVKKFKEVMMFIKKELRLDETMLKKKKF